MDELVGISAPLPFSVSSDLRVLRLCFGLGLAVASMRGGLCRTRWFVSSGSCSAPPYP